jgi:dienelactone hydrolase
VTRGRRAFAALCLASALSGCALLVKPPAPPAGSPSALRFAPGPHRVRARNVVYADAARGRRLASTIWWPDDVRGPAPLVVQTHGFLANRTGGTYVARHLASRGYVVVAATHPTTTLFARGGAKLAEVIRQPGDVSLLIDRMLAGDTGVPGVPAIDPARIAVMGHSLGGLTATLAAFHPRLRDPRIAAAISIAGPMAMLEPRFFATAAVPFLMIAGSADVVVDWRRNALVTLDRVPGGTLVLLAGGSHAGFDYGATKLPAAVRNPDVFACWVLARTLHLDTAVATVRALSRPDEGVDLEAIRPPCLDLPPRVSMRPARQQMITTLAVAAFLESVFAETPEAKARARAYLTTTLPRDLADVRVATAPAAHPADAAAGL